MKKIIILILLFPLFFNGQTVFNSLGATIYGVIDTGNTNPIGWILLIQLGK